MEKVHDNMTDAFDNIAKEAEKLTPWALMTAGTKVSHPLKGQQKLESDYYIRISAKPFCISFQVSVMVHRRERGASQFYDSQS